MSENQHYQTEMLALSKKQSQKYWYNQKKEINIISDCDGIMTSANLTYSTEGKRTKHFSVNDSLAVDFLKEHFKGQFRLLVLTGDKGPGLEVTKSRLDQIGVPFVSCKNVYKYKWITENCFPDNTVYIGDDIYDFKIFKEYYGCTVNNAPEIVQRHAKYISPYEGGKSAFTDILFHIIELNGYDVEAELEKYIEFKTQQANLTPHDSI
jgi:3-deoxy-D-manno-octulosonate 8-phosphate phosphatase KdsC-like HAD superfamily phosphatase